MQPQRPLLRGSQAPSHRVPWTNPRPARPLGTKNVPLGFASSLRSPCWPWPQLILPKHPGMPLNCSRQRDAPLQPLQHPHWTQCSPCDASMKMKKWKRESWALPTAPGAGQRAICHSTAPDVTEESRHQQWHQNLGQSTLQYPESMAKGYPRAVGPARFFLRKEAYAV